MTKYKNAYTEVYAILEQLDEEEYNQIPSEVITAIRENRNTEYEFELVKVKAILQSDEEMEMYLKMIKNSKIKESIFCYWCTIYEEELFQTKEIENMVNKVLISELEKTKYKSKVFLMIENNKTQILETGTEVNFIDIVSYIEEMKNEKTQFEKIYKYINKDEEDVLLVGIKMKKK